MSDGTGLAEALLGLDGFRVLAVSETPAELVIEIEIPPRWFLVGRSSGRVLVGGGRCPSDFALSATWRRVGRNRQDLWTGFSLITRRLPDPAVAVAR